MERNLTTLSGSEREVRIHLTTTDLKPHYEQAYLRAQPTIKLQGFRPGKVPMAMIKQRFGREIENEALDTIADTEFRSFIEAEKQQVVGTPALTDIQKASDGITFTIKYEVMPDFELGEYRNLEIQRPMKTVEESDIQDELDRIALRAASFEPAEFTDGVMYVVTVSMNELDKETSMPILGAEAREERVFLDDDAVDMHLRNNLAEKRVGDSFTYVAETQDENQQPPSYRVTLTDIQRVVPAAFNNEFVETITGGKMHTTEELREDIRLQLDAYYKNASKQAVENQLVDQLIAAHDIPAPESLVHAVIHQLFDDFKERNKEQPGIDKITAHDVEPQFRPNAERIVRWELIRNKIIEAEKLVVTDEDLADLAATYNLEVDQIRMAMRQQRGMEDQLLADKAVRTLLDYAIISDVNVASEESLD